MEENQQGDDDDTGSLGAEVMSKTADLFKTQSTLFQEDE